jgi:hypothetical protein
MNNLFLVNVKYTKASEDTDGYKCMNETYLVNAVSFTDAEVKTTKAMEFRLIKEFSPTINFQVIYLIYWGLLCSYPLF